MQELLHYSARCILVDSHYFDNRAAGLADFGCNIHFGSDLAAGTVADLVVGTAADLVVGTAADFGCNMADLAVGTAGFVVAGNNHHLVAGSVDFGCTNFPPGTLPGNSDWEGLGYTQAESSAGCNHCCCSGTDLSHLKDHCYNFAQDFPFLDPGSLRRQ